LAVVKSKGERASFVRELLASQESPARSHSSSLSLGMDRLFLMESSVPSVPKLVLVFAASWDGLRETVCLDLIWRKAASSRWKRGSLPGLSSSVGAKGRTLLPLAPARLSSPRGSTPVSPGGSGTCFSGDFPVVPACCARVCATEQSQPPGCSQRS